MVGTEMVAFRSACGAGFGLGGSGFGLGGGSAGFGAGFGLGGSGFGSTGAGALPEPCSVPFGEPVVGPGGNEGWGA